MERTTPGRPGWVVAREVVRARFWEWAVQSIAVFKDSIMSETTQPFIVHTTISFVNGGLLATFTALTVVSQLTVSAEGSPDGVVGGIINPHELSLDHQ